MLNFVLCDDNQNVSDRLSQMLESLFIKHDLDANISLIESNPISVYKYVENNVVNVLFLDIDLKSQMSGLDLAENIRKINKNIYIIFTSAHLEYVLVAYKYKTFDFLPKPITIERLEETVIRLIDDMNNNTKNNIFIRLDNKNTIINQDTVYFIKKDGMKLVFNTSNRSYEVYSSFNKIASELPKNFIRCHKSYIANINKIINIDTNDNIIFFDSNRKIKCYIGPKYKNEFMEVLENDRNFTNNMDSIKHRK